jgi:hypothetical protein
MNIINIYVYIYKERERGFTHLINFDPYIKEIKTEKEEIERKKRRKEGREEEGRRREGKGRPIDRTGLVHTKVN